MKLSVASSCLLALAAAPVVLVQGRYEKFFINAVDNDETNQKELHVRITDKAGVADKQMLEFIRGNDKYRDLLNLEIYAMRFAEGGLRNGELKKRILDWEFGEDSIVAYLPDEWQEDINSASILVGGTANHPKFAGYHDEEPKVDELIFDFTSDQLLFTRDKTKLADITKAVLDTEKAPFRATMTGCGRKILVSVFGLTSDVISEIPEMDINIPEEAKGFIPDKWADKMPGKSKMHSGSLPEDSPEELSEKPLGINANATATYPYLGGPKPLEACIYEPEGYLVACTKLQRIKTFVFAKFDPSDLELLSDKTIFAATSALFPSDEFGPIGVVRKIATVSADFKETCDTISY